MVLILFSLVFLNIVHDFLLKKECEMFVLDIGLQAKENGRQHDRQQDQPLDPLFDAASGPAPALLLFGFAHSCSSAPIAFTVCFATRSL